MGRSKPNIFQAGNIVLQNRPDSDINQCKACIYELNLKRQLTKTIVMKTSKREILIYYNPESSRDRKTVAYALSLSKYVKAYSFQQSPCKSNTDWCRILAKLNIHPKELLDKSHPYYQANIRGHEFDEEGWFNILRTNPELIKAPIAMRGEKVVLCLNPKDIYRLAKEEEEEEAIV